MCQDKGLYFLVIERVATSHLRSERKVAAFPGNTPSHMHLAPSNDEVDKPDIVEGADYITTAETAGGVIMLHK